MQSKIRAVPLVLYLGELRGWQGWGGVLLHVISVPPTTATIAAAISTLVEVLIWFMVPVLRDSASSALVQVSSP